jgi:hypothetical protein
MTTSEELKAEIEALREEVRLRRKWGNSVSPEQLQEIAEREKKEKAGAEQRARDQEEARVRDAARVKEIKAAAVRFVRDGRIIVNLAGVRVPTITEGLAVACPECGSPISQAIQDALFIFSKDWLECSAPEIRYSGYSPVLKQTAGHFMSSPAWLDTLKCPSCKATASCVVQLVIC